KFYPIVRGRLTAVNDKATATDVDNGQDGGVGRELNLTYSEQLPEGNRLLAGEWTKQAQSVSVESGLAERLQLSIGDSVTLDLAGQSVTAQVRNIREVDWESLKPNFYFIFSPDVLNEYSAT